MQDDVVGAATRVFAGLGYDGATAQMIAEAAGVPLAEVTAIGGKRGLYEAVMGRVLNEQMVLVEEIESTFTPDLDGFHRMADRFIDFYFGHPETVALWRHRGLSDAADLPDVEGEYAAPLQRVVQDRLLGRVGLSERSLLSLTNVLSWAFHGFLSDGMLLLDGTIVDWQDRKARAWFRSEVHGLIDRLAVPPVA
ncbi:hypothetical protein GCM10022221_49200 [Actinocorallia aurea]